MRFTVAMPLALLALALAGFAVFRVLRGVEALVLCLRGSLVGVSSLGSDTGQYGTSSLNHVAVPDRTFASASARCSSGWA